MLTFALLMAACGGENSGKTTDKTTQVDSAYYQKNSSHASCTVKANLPAERLNQPVGEWLDEALGGIYPGDPTDIQGIVDFYGTSMTDSLEKFASEMEIPEEERTPMEQQVNMEYAYETDKYVTYTLSTYTDLGGAHPTATEKGATFRKKDGRRVGWDIIAGHDAYNFQQLLKKHLKEYFNAGTDEELVDMLADIDPDNIPLPHTPPYFLEDGIVMIYQQYEIAPYAAGMPNALFTYDELKPMLTGWAKRMIE